MEVIGVPGKSHLLGRRVALIHVIGSRLKEAFFVKVGRLLGVCVC